MSAFEITGKLHKVFDTESKTASFQTREFVILTPDDKYPQYVKFQLAQERVNIIDPYQEGNEIKVHFDLRGREWQGKYFTNLNAWRIEAAGGNSNSGEEFVPKETSTPFDLQDDADDLPF
ncbi:MAG TPA: DUF3127 domain-containing protein [Saprospiraceae bacterium]|mgnify:CR=1 FL=1|nr:DUF3127 domain-containing protein [Saprospiraceae bacterium]HQW54942.1 DUF3127 domain-containing protein [Saprospiraceae bacterium]